MTMKPEDQAPAEPAPTPTQTIKGAESVKLSDGRHVTVRQIPCNAWDDARELMFDESGLIEFVCTEPRGFAASMDPGDRTKVAEAVERQNGDFFAFCDRFMKRLRMMPPDLIRGAIGRGR